MKQIYKILKKIMEHRKIFWCYSFNVNEYKSE